MSYLVFCVTKDRVQSMTERYPHWIAVCREICKRGLSFFVANACAAALNEVQPWPDQRINRRFVYVAAHEDFWRDREV